MFGINIEAIKNILSNINSNSFALKGRLSQLKSQVEKISTSSSEFANYNGKRCSSNTEVVHLNRGEARGNRVDVYKRYKLFSISGYENIPNICNEIINRISNIESSLSNLSSKVSTAQSNVENVSDMLNKAAEALEGDPSLYYDDFSRAFAVLSGSIYYNEYDAANGSNVIDPDKLLTQYWTDRPLHFEKTDQGSYRILQLDDNGNLCTMGFTDAEGINAYAKAMAQSSNPTVRSNFDTSSNTSGAESMLAAGAGVIGGLIGKFGETVGNAVNGGRETLGNWASSHGLTYGSNQTAIDNKGNDKNKYVKSVVGSDDNDTVVAATGSHKTNKVGDGSQKTPTQINREDEQVMKDKAQERAKSAVEGAREADKDNYGNNPYVEKTKSDYARGKKAQEIAKESAQIRTENDKKNQSYAEKSEADYARGQEQQSVRNRNNVSSSRTDIDTNTDTATSANAARQEQQSIRNRNNASSSKTSIDTNTDTATSANAARQEQQSIRNRNNASSSKTSIDTNTDTATSANAAQQEQQVNDQSSDLNARDKGFPSSMDGDPTAPITIESHKNSDGTYTNEYSRNGQVFRKDTIDSTGRLTQFFDKNGDVSMASNLFNNSGDNGLVRVDDRSDGRLVNYFEGRSDKLSESVRYDGTQTQYYVNRPDGLVSKVFDKSGNRIVNYKNNPDGISRKFFDTFGNAYTVYEDGSTYKNGEIMFGANYTPEDYESKK